MSAAIPSFDASEEKKKFLIGLFILCFTGFIIEYGLHQSLLKPIIKISLLTGFTYGLFLAAPLAYHSDANFNRQFFILSLVQFTVIAFATFVIESKPQTVMLSLLFFVPIVYLAPVFKNNGNLRHGFGILPPENFIFIVYGVLLGFFLGAHLVFSASLTQKYVAHISNIPRLFYGVCFSFGMNAPMEEIFYRGFAFKKLFEKGFSFWSAAAVSSFLSALRFCSNPLFTSTPVAIIGVFFYITLTQMLYCALFRFSRSLLPSYLCNAVFGSAFYLLSAV